MATVTETGRVSRVALARIAPAIATTIACALLVVALAASRDPAVFAQDVPSASRATVTLATLGTFPRALADAVERGLRAELQVEVRRMNDVPLPRAAYYAPRRRYRADALLDHLHTLVPRAGRARVIGMTDVDISTTKGRVFDWGVFGLGDLDGSACVISTHRLRRRARNAAHVEFRVVSTAVHEVGHTLGLDHCVEPRCVMRDAEGSITTVDTSTGRLGPECRAELDAARPIAPREP